MKNEGAKKNKLNKSNLSNTLVINKPSHAKPISHTSISNVTSSVEVPKKDKILKNSKSLIPNKESILQEKSKEEKISKKTTRYVYNSLTDDERKVYKILSDEPLYIDDVVKESGVESRLASKVLLGLELKRLIKELPGKQFIRTEN